MVLKGLTKCTVSSCGEALALLERGTVKRRTAETLLNSQSSRSHAGEGVLRGQGRGRAHPTCTC